MEKIIIPKEAKALLNVINNKDMRFHFRGVLVSNGKVSATDTKILAEMELSPLEKSEVPTNIKTGADTDRVWLSFENIKKAFSQIIKKPAIPSIQDNVYVHKQNGKIELMVLDNNMQPMSIVEPENTFADDYPKVEKVYPGEAERIKITIDGTMLCKLAAMCKDIDKEDAFIEMEIEADNKIVKYKITGARGVSHLGINGVFMPRKNR